MRSFEIGVDVDETVVPFVKPAVEFLRGIGIHVPSYEETPDFNLAVAWKCPGEEAIKRVNLFLRSDEFASLTPLPGAKDAFSRLFPPHNYHTITSRPDGVEPITRKFFDEHLGGRYKSIHHLGNYEHKRNTTKAEVANRLGLDLFIEDTYPEAIAIAKTGIPVLLMNRPWNVGREISDGITRVNDWDEIVRYIESQANGNL